MSAILTVWLFVLFNLKIPTLMLPIFPKRWALWEDWLVQMLEKLVRCSSLQILLLNTVFQENGGKFSLLSSWWLAVNVSYQGKRSLNSADAINYHRYKREIILFSFWNEVNTTWFIDKLGNRSFFKSFEQNWRHWISVWLLKKAVLPRFSATWNSAEASAST